MFNRRYVFRREPCLKRLIFISPQPVAPEPHSMGGKNVDAVIIPRGTGTLNTSVCSDVPLKHFSNFYPNMILLVNWTFSNTKVSMPVIVLKYVGLPRIFNFDYKKIIIKDNYI